MRKLLFTMVVMTAVACCTTKADAFDVKNRFMISAGGGIGIPIGDFGDDDTSNVHAGGANTGFMAGISIEYGISEQVIVGGRFAYNRFSADAHVYSNAFPISDAYEAHWTIYEILGVYSKWMLRPGRQTRPYVRGGAFLGIPEAYLETDGLDVSQEFDPSIGLDLGLGVTQQVSGHVLVSLEGRISHLFVNQKNSDEGFSGVSSPANVTTANGVRDPGGNINWLAVNGYVTYGF